MKYQYQYHIRRGEINPASGITLFDAHHKAVMNDFYENCIHNQDSDYVRVNMNYVSLLYIGAYDKADQKHVDAIDARDLTDDLKQKLQENQFLILGYALIFPEESGLYHVVSMIESRIKRKKCAAFLLQKYQNKYKLKLKPAPAEIPQSEESIKFWEYYLPYRIRFDYIDIDPYTWSRRYVKWDKNPDEPIYDNQNDNLKKMIGKELTTTELLKMGILPSDHHDFLDFDMNTYKWKINVDIAIIADYLFNFKYHPFPFDSLGRVLSGKESVNREAIMKLIHDKYNPEELEEFERGRIYKGIKQEENKAELMSKPFVLGIIYSTNFFGTCALTHYHSKGCILQKYLDENHLEYEEGCCCNGYCIHIYYEKYLRPILKHFLDYQSITPNTLNEDTF